MDNPTAVVIILAHKSDLDPWEKISLLQCYRVLGSHPIRIVCPQGLNVDRYREVVPQAEFDFINPKWQSSYAWFNRLKILPFLYRRYRMFEYILFYELDAFVFRDELIQWCRRGYDYVGAPWPAAENGFDLTRAGVGNGVFSLRRVKSMLRVTRSFRWVDPPLHAARKYHLSKGQWIRGAALLLLNATTRNNTFSLLNTWRWHEDAFWGEKVPGLFPWFRLAPPAEAARFSFEERPRQLFTEIGGTLPFGCHAWARNDLEFWRPHINAAGYLVEQAGPSWTGGEQGAHPSLRAILIEPFFHRAGHFPEEAIQLAHALQAAGASVEVVTPKAVHLEALNSRAAGVPAWLIEVAPRTAGVTRAVIDSLTIWWCVRAAVKAARADTVLVGVSGRFLAYFAAAALTRDRAWVFFSRDFSRFQQPATIDRLLHGPTHVLARAAGKRNRVSLISIVDPDIAPPEDSFGLPMIYIPPVGVRAPAQIPRRKDARLRLGLPPDDPLLLVFGLGHSGKDYSVIFRALKHLHSPLKIVFAGAVPKESPEQPRDLKQRFDRDDRVLVRDGWIPREEVPDYFAAADGLLLSYRSGYVVDSGVLCEGVAMDLPLLGTEQGSIGHYVKEWHLGLTFSAGDALALARQMEVLATMPSAGLAAFADGRKRFSKHFSWQRIAAEHLGLYQNLLR